MGVRVVTVAGDAALEARLAGALAARDDVDLLFRCVDRVELLACIRSDPIDALITVGLPTWFDRGLADEARSRGISTLGLPGNDMEAVLLERSSFTVVEGDPDAVVAAVSTPAEAVRAIPRMPVGAKRGRLIAVWGPKGSPGRTTVAIELAAVLAEHDDATLLVDADQYGGDIAQKLGVVEDVPTVVWAAKLAAKDELDAGRMAIDLRRAGERGPVLMPGLARAQMWPEITAHAWRRVLETATSEFASTVADVGFCLEPAIDLYGGEDGRNRMARVTIESADHVVAVCRADPIGIKNFLWAMEDLVEITGSDRVVVVANRVRRRDEPDVAELIRKHIGSRPVAYIPHRPDEHHRAVMYGRSLAQTAPGCDAVAAVRSVAAAVGSAPRPAGFLSRLGAR